MGQFAITDCHRGSEITEAPESLNMQVAMTATDLTTAAKKENSDSPQIYGHLGNR